MAAPSLGAYEVITRLASGGMAEIFVARATADRSRLAIVKRMLPQYIDKPEFVEMFLDEGRTVSLLRHPNIVRMYDFGFADDVPYLAMEYLHGVDLRTITRAFRAHGPMPLEFAVAIVAAVCAGLHHAHHATSLEGHPMEIVHRDVSPQNIMITLDGTAKLIDFGIAKRRGRTHETRAGALKGKVPYMAPEQVRGTALDARTDLYAAGVVLYELVTGHRPYRLPQAERPSEFSLMMAIVAHEVVPASRVRPDVPPALEAVIGKALAASPDQRYQSGEEMQRALLDAARVAGFALDPGPLAAFLRDAFGERDARWRAALRRGPDELATEIDALDRLRTAAAGGAPDGDDGSEPEVSLSRGDEPAPPPPPATGAISLVTLEPRIDEKFRGKERAADLSGAVVLDLGAVERISSFGVREWLELQRAVGERAGAVELYLARCSEAAVTQIGMVRAFVGTAQLVSFLAPYVCDACGHAFAWSFDCERDAAAVLVPRAPQVPCPACAQPAHLDDDLSYFAALRPYVGRQVPAAVRDLVDRLEAASRDRPAVDKHVDGARTKLVVSRPIEHGVRWPRLLDGTEGEVELDVAGAQLDHAGVAAVSVALRGLGPEVTAVRVLGAPPALCAALATVPRTIVESVAVGGRCPRCNAARTALTTPTALAALTAGDPVALACRRCDTPLVDLELAGAPRAATVAATVAPVDEAAAPARRHGRRIVTVAAVAAGCVAVAIAAYVAATHGGGIGATAAAARSDGAPAPRARADAAAAGALRDDAATAADPITAVGDGQGSDPAAALAGARTAALRQIIAQLERALPGEARAFADPAADPARVVGWFDERAGARFPIDRTTARPISGGVRATYAMRRADFAAAVELYAASRAAWGATLGEAPPSRPPGVVVRAVTRGPLAAGDRLLAVDDRPISGLSDLPAGAPAARLTVLRDGRSRDLRVAPEAP